MRLIPHRPLYAVLGGFCMTLFLLSKNASTCN
jgi:hypothetical protein